MRYLIGSLAFLAGCAATPQAARTNSEPLPALDGPSQAVVVPSADSAGAAVAIEVVTDAWLDAYERAEPDVLAGLFLVDGMYAANTGQLLRGRAAIEEGVRGWIAIRPQFFARFGLGQDSEIDVDREVMRFRTLGESAYSLLRFTARVEPSNCLMDRGHALAVWRRLDNGEWRMESLVVNHDGGEPPEDACATRAAGRTHRAAGRTHRTRPGESVRVVRFIGTLGDGSNTDSNVPARVDGGLDFAAIGGGTVHTCGLTTVGRAYCWGNNFSGELGDGSNVDSNVPVAVALP